jgi:hypothetical protein
MRSNSSKPLIKSGEIAMRVHMSREIGFSIKVLRLIGCPFHLDFWWGDKEKLLFVGAAKEPSETSIKLPNSTYTRNGAPFVRNKKLRQAIQGLTGIADNSIAIFHGEYVPEVKMVAFQTCVTTRAEVFEDE